MPSGRLGRCIIPARKGVELYVNSSGSEASVTIQTQVISTTANVEQTVVVGVAATTLSETTAITQSPVGTYTSIGGFVYSCWASDSSVGYSTISGAIRTPICCIDDSCNITQGTYEGGASASHFRYVDPNSGNNTFGPHAGCICGACEVSGNSFRCCYRGEYGGNELQNPLIWLMQEAPDDHPGGKYGYPRHCSCCNWFWGDMVVGWNPGNKYNFCCPYNRACQAGNGDWLLRAPQLIGCGTPGSACYKGVGIFKTDIAITTMQMYVNPCCCCGYTGANQWPVARWEASGCSSSSSCCGGPPCNYAGCKFVHYNCCGSGSFCCAITLGFNWYSLCSTTYCCCRRTDGSGITNSWTEFHCHRSQKAGPFGNMGVGDVSNSLNCCMQCMECNTLISWQQMRMTWCGQQACCYGSNPDAAIFMGAWTTCFYMNNSTCGVMCFYHHNFEMGQCCCNDASCWWESLQYKYRCNCNYFPNCGYRARGGGNNYNYIISPYGFDHGMTNCYWAHHSCKTTGDYDVYTVGWPDPRISGGSCQSRCNCNQYWAKHMYLSIKQPTDIGHVGSELSIKYVAWNPFDCYVYMAVRSSEPQSCGIFRIDAHKQRLFHGPVCGCTSYNTCSENNCNGNCRSESFFLHCLSVPACGNLHQLEYCKIADWPKCWAQPKYKVASFCVSCLFRNERCNWIMDIFNHTSGKWDSYSTQNLYEWNLVQNSETTDPFRLKVSDTLDIQATTDFACITTICNCFMSNIDCSGLIDWCFSANQYERNGIVLSNGDRVMINNNSDEKLSAQIWGYEG